MREPRKKDWSDRLLPWLIGAAILAAVVVGVRSIGRAQTGELGESAGAAAKPGVLAAPELEREHRAVRECRDANGRRVYTGADCATDGPVTEVETVPVELAPPR